MAPGGSNDDGGRIQVQQVQQQQVGTQQVTVQAANCPGSQTERVLRDPTRGHRSDPNITGGAVLITYQVFEEPDNPDDELFFESRDEDGDIVISEIVDDDTNGPRTIRATTDPGTHEFEVEADLGVNHEVRLEDCTNVEARNDGGDGDGGGDGADDGADDPVDLPGRLPILVHREGET